MRAIVRFGAPLHGLTAEDLETAGTIYQIGVKPVRIDIITALSGLEFDDAWPARVTTILDGTEYPVIGKEALIRNKRATGRTQDLADVEALERLP